MIKVYKIKIGEKVYEVEVEAVSEKEGKIETESAKEAKEEKPKETVKTSVSEGDTKVEAPMQGLVVSVDVSAGQKVKVGETLVVLEAMKMENPIIAPVDGTVAGIHVSKGDTVETGTLMVSLS